MIISDKNIVTNHIALFNFRLQDNGSRQLNDFMIGRNESEQRTIISRLERVCAEIFVQIDILYSSEEG